MCLPAGVMLDHALASVSALSAFTRAGGELLVLQTCLFASLGTLGAGILTSLARIDHQGAVPLDHPRREIAKGLTITGQLLHALHLWITPRLAIGMPGGAVAHLRAFATLLDALLEDLGMLIGRSLARSHARRLLRRLSPHRRLSRRLRLLPLRRRCRLLGLRRLRGGRPGRSILSFLADAGRQPAQ
jgi:hypothetical protein